MATLSRITVHPIKALDPEERRAATISEVGGLAGDRVYGIVNASGTYVNGKRSAAVHRLRTSVDLDAGVVEVGEQGSEEADRFHLDDDRDDLAGWLSAYFGYEVDLEAAPGGELADSRVYSDIVAGATVVSTATLREVASWFPALDVADVRRRFRSNLEVSGVDAFWEDRLVAEAGRGEPPRLRIGDVTFEGVKPLTRCVVPTRDPDTGEATDGFRERFVEGREETFPQWADPGALDHFYSLTSLVHPEETFVGSRIERGDDVELVD